MAVQQQQQTLQVPAAGGNWNATTTWTGGVVPIAGDNVTFAANAVVTITADAACATLTWAAGNLTANRTSTINAGYTLTVLGAVTYRSPGATFNRSINVLGNLNCASIAMPNTGGNTQDCILAIGSSGIVTVSGSITMTGVFLRNHIDITGSGTINIGGNVNNGAGAVGGGFTTPPATSVINLNGTAAQTVFLYGGASSLGILEINNAAGVTSGSTMTVRTLTIGDITDNSVFSDGTFATTVSGNLFVNGTLSGTGAVTLNGTGTTIDGSGTISVSTTINANQTIPSTANLVVTGAITISNGFTVTNNGIVTASSLLSTGAWTQGTNSTLNYSGVTFTPTLTATASGNTVNFTGGAGQTIPGITYYDLGFSGAGTKTIAAGTTITVSNNWAIGSTTAMTATANATITGNITGTGAITMGSGTIAVSGDFSNSGAFTSGNRDCQLQWKFC